jgi:4-oxalocrotonate tautomerase
MPEVFVYMFEGRTLDQKRALVSQVTDAVMQSLSVPSDTVTVQLVEGPMHNRSRGGQLISDKRQQGGQP